MTEDSAGTGQAADAYPVQWGEPHVKQSTWFWPEQLRRSFADISGIELMHGIADGRFPPPPIMSLFDARILSVERGEVIFGCTPDRSFLNPAGLVHGGFLCTMMDTAIGCAVITESGPLQAYATIELKVSFFTPMPLDGRQVEVVGSVQSLGRRVAFAEAHAYDPDRNLLGHATSSLAAVRRGPEVPD
jgi:uncharacterized protein (TIGR00369 family)